MKWLMFIPFHLILKPLIKRNYRLRAQGKLPDKWYWADRLSVKYGYFVESQKPQLINNCFLGKKLAAHEYSLKTEYEYSDNPLANAVMYDYKSDMLFEFYTTKTVVTSNPVTLDSPFERNDT